jgi:hypothetical protein
MVTAAGSAGRAARQRQVIQIPVDMVRLLHEDVTRRYRNARRAVADHAIFVIEEAEGV